MKQVKLLKLELTNYRNIDHEVYDFAGSNAKIVGENRIGKTNTLEAIHFLLTNYLLDGSNDLTQLKPLVDTKRVVSAKAVFSVWETTTPQVPPKEITIEKQYGENWVTKRGVEKPVLDGHYEDYFFNDVKQTRAKDFYALLGQHFGYRNDEKGEVDIAQLLCNPLYLGNLGDSDKWTLLRKYIVSLIGDVTDEEVYQAEPSTLAIKEDMERNLNNAEQVKKQYNNDINSIQQSITAHNSNIALIEKTPKPTDEEVAVAKEGIEQHQKKIAELQSATGTSQAVAQYEKLVSDTKEQVLNLNMKELKAYQDNKGNPNAQADKDIADLNKHLTGLVEKKMSINDDMREAKNNYADAKKHYDECVSTRASLVDQLKGIRAKKKEPIEVVTICPTCGRPLDEDKVEEARQKIMNDYIKGEEETIKRGKAIAEQLTKYEQDMNKFQDEVQKCNDAYAQVLEEISATKEKIAGVESSRVPTGEFVESKELKDLRAKLSSYEQQLNDARLDESKAHTLGLEQISKEKEAMLPLQKVLDDKAYYDRQMQVLNSVKTEKEECSKKLTALEQKKECLNLFISSKLRLIDTHVAKVFGNIRFQLIKENINGGFDQVCKPYIYDVDKDASTSTLWKSGSKSEKIITGIAIAEAIKNYLGLTELPYVFDEGGEISTDTFATKFKTDAQIICVKVEDNILKPVVVKF